MFRVDRLQNRIARLPKRSFSQLGLRERDHLQEWLVHQTDALGEELLVIQKEFDGFDETRERLDLLALDKEGNLVIIENKLDDSGRDVTWQALKYTAYVSGLTRNQIVDIYQQYLTRHEADTVGSAAERICEFLEVEEIDEAVVNPGNGQRMIFIAANFRREVTATVLWLLGRGIRAQCFRVIPFGYEDELFIDLQQIIPPPEAADYMIGVSTKEVEESSSQGKLKQRHIFRQKFWTTMLEKLRKDGVTLFGNISPSKDHWLNAGSGVRGCPYTMIFGRDVARVEVSLNRASQEENKWLFDQLYGRKTEIEESFGSPLTWRRIGDKKQSLVVYSLDVDGYNKENWPSIIQWLSEHIQKLQNAFQSHLIELNRNLPRFGSEDFSLADPSIED